MTLPLVASLRGLFLVGTLRVLVSAERRDLPSFSAGTSMPPRPPLLAVPLVVLAFVFELVVFFVFIVRLVLELVVFVVFIVWLVREFGLDHHVELVLLLPPYPPTASQ